MIKVLEKNRTIVNINQDNKNYVYEIPSQNNPKWRKAWGSPTKIRYGFLLFQPLFNIVLEEPAGTMRQEEEIEENRKRKGQTILIYSWYDICYTLDIPNFLWKDKNMITIFSSLQMLRHFIILISNTVSFHFSKKIKVVLHK